MEEITCISQFEEDISDHKTFFIKITTLENLKKLNEPGQKQSLDKNWNFKRNFQLLESLSQESGQLICETALEIFNNKKLVYKKCKMIPLFDTIDL